MATAGAAEPTDIGIGAGEFQPTPPTCEHHHHHHEEAKKTHEVHPSPSDSTLLQHHQQQHAQLTKSETHLSAVEESSCCGLHPAWKSVCDSIQTAVEIQNPHLDRDVIHRWHTAERKVAMIAAGSSRSEHDPLLLQVLHWLEATDPQHRNGSNLKPYFTHWKNLQETSSDDGNFFHWLDYGEGKTLDLPQCPRSKLESQLVHYCNAEERLLFLVDIQEGIVRYKYPHPNRHSGASFLNLLKDLSRTSELGELVDSESLGGGLIYVMDTDHNLYINKKVRGQFHHSSFLAGGAAIAAGAMVICQGKIVSISPQSGHYRPSHDDFERFKSILTQRGVDLSTVTFVEAGEGEG